MTDKHLLEELEASRSKQPLGFWGLLIASLSIWYGWFITAVEGYLLAHSEPYFQQLPEKAIGVALVIVGLVKVIGVLTHNGKMKKIGILGLSALWSGIFVLALTFSFGSGYPHPSYIFMGGVVIACFRVSLKGDFN